MRGLKIFIIIFLFIVGSVISTADDAFIYDSHGKRDPFVPLVGPGVRYIPSGLEELEDTTPQVSSEGFVLNGIVWDPNGECLAVINGEIYKVNDEMDTCTITAIKENMVVFLDKEGKEKTLTLYVEQSEIDLQGGDENVQNKE